MSGPTRSYGSAGAKPTVGTVVDKANDNVVAEEAFLAAVAKSTPGAGGPAIGKSTPGGGGSGGAGGSLGDPGVPNTANSRINYSGMKGGLALLEAFGGAGNGATIMSAIFLLQQDALKGRSFARTAAFAEGMSKIAVAFQQASENMKLIDEQKSLAEEKYSNAMVGAWCSIIGGALQMAGGAIQASGAGSEAFGRGIGTMSSGLGTTASGLTAYFNAQSQGAEANSSQWELKKNVEKLNVRKAEADMSSQQADQAKDDANEHLKSVKDMAQKIWASKVENMNKANLRNG